MLLEAENKRKILPKRILYSTENTIAVMYSNKSRNKIQESMWDSRILHGNAVLHITIALYFTNSDVEYALDNFYPHIVLGPLTCLYKKASFSCFYSNCQLAVCKLCNELSRCQIHIGEWMSVGWSLFEAHQCLSYPEKQRLYYLTEGYRIVMSWERASLLLSF